MSAAVAPTRPWPWRMIVLGAFQDAWSMADQPEKNEVFAALKDAFVQWEQMGAQLVATLDDELSVVGQPGARMWNFYSVWEIPEPSLSYDLLNVFRDESPDAIRLDAYFRLETVVGKPVVGIERAVGLRPATAPEASS